MQEQGGSCRATLGEVAVRKGEIRAISKYLQSGLTIVDLGCGNGYSTIEWAKKHDSRFVGIDYVPEMVDRATESLVQVRFPLKGEIQFQVGDVTALTLDDDSFDIAITERCLQNLPSFELQISTIEGISRILRKNGLFLMLECSRPAVVKINRVRAMVGLAPIEVEPWHNLFFDDDELVDSVHKRTRLALVKVDHFASNYMFFTRLFPGWVATIVRKTKLEKVLWRLPQIGSWGYFRLFVWRKVG